MPFKVVDRIKMWMGKDNINKLELLLNFQFIQINQEDGSQLRHLMDGVEPHWGEIRTLVMDSASQFKPIAPYPFY
jgi:hypothetical protein